MISTTSAGLARAVPPALASVKDAPAARTCPPGSTILLIEDVEATRTGLAELLRLRGHEVKEAADGEEGLRLLREDPGVCAVVLDLQMANMDGYAFRRQQLGEPGIGHVPVIVFTAASDPASVRSELQVETVLSKPFGVGDLLDALVRMCPGA
jgi:CheY-like chemotaxis protein